MIFIGSLPRTKFDDIDRTAFWLFVVVRIRRVDVISTEY